MDSSRAANCQHHFYPRSPCGERQSGFFFFSRLDAISIHALLAESDQTQGPQTYHQCLFLSTLSLRRATRALRQLQSTLRYFYPRSPCGERPHQEPYLLPS